MRKAVLLMWVAVAMLPVLGSEAHAENKCGDSRPATYRPAAGDRTNTTQLHATLAAPHELNKLEVNVCAGTLKIERGPASSPVSLHIESPGADRSLGEYLHDFNVAGGALHVDVRVPSNYHATVTLSVPAPAHASGEVNLGAGTLLVDVAAMTGGDRQINLGAGDATLLLSRDRDYAKLSVNIGMGRLEDQRTGGTATNGIIAKELQGTGKGSIELNVGAGKALLKGEPE